jgi:hypothetical protein
MAFVDTSGAPVEVATARKKAVPHTDPEDRLLIRDRIILIASDNGVSSREISVAFDLAPRTVREILQSLKSIREEGE